MVLQSAVSSSDLAAELGVIPASQLAPRNSLPTPSALSDVFPQGIRRGSTLGVQSTTLLLLLLSEPTKAGNWVAITGFPDIGVVAAQEMGVQLERCVFIPYCASNSAPRVFAALIDTVDVVVIHDANFIHNADARRLIARARERQCVLVLSKTFWQQVTPLSLQVVSSTWRQTANGYGRLKGRWVQVSVSGKGSMSRPTNSSIWIGEGDGGTTPQKTVALRPYEQKAPA